MVPGRARARRARGATGVPAAVHVTCGTVPSAIHRTGPLEAFATMVLATLGDFVDEPVLSKEQIILARC